MNKLTGESSPPQSYAVRRQREKDGEKFRKTFGDRIPRIARLRPSIIAEHYRSYTFLVALSLGEFPPDSSHRPEEEY